VRHFYTQFFIGQHPPDTTIVPLTRTVGDDRIVDELIYQFTHTIEMPWMLPGVAPTGHRVSAALVVVVEFAGEKISAERIYWDQASVLAQIGLLNAEELPVTGREAAHKVAEPAQERSNLLIARAGRG
jgi:carboxymethylenebutenolidase